MKKHTFVPPFTTRLDTCIHTENNYTCLRKENNLEVHESSPPDYEEQNVHLDNVKDHPFLNVAGTISCGVCFNTKEDSSHIQTSQDATTYRKPIAYRFDLIPPIALRRLAAIYEEGANVYGVSKYISSPMKYSNVVNHLINHLTLYQSGDNTEDHLAKIAWAACTLIVYGELKIGEDDLTNYGIKVDDK